MQCWSLRDQVWNRGQYSKGQKTRERRTPSLELCLEHTIGCSLETERSDASSAPPDLHWLESLEL